MAGVNKAILIGNLGADPEVKVLSNGETCANFTLATSEKYTDRQGVKQEKTEWHRIVVWKRLAEIAQEFLHKGSKVYVEGKLQTRSWEDQQGVKRYTTEITGLALQLLDSKPSEAAPAESDELPF